MEWSVCISVTQKDKVSLLAQFLSRVRTVKATNRTEEESQQQFRSGRCPAGDNAGERPGFVGLMDSCRHQYSAVQRSTLQDSGNPYP